MLCREASERPRAEEVLLQLLGHSYFNEVHEASEAMKVLKKKIEDAVKNVFLIVQSIV